MELTALIALGISLVALVTASVTLRRVERYKMTAPQVRELVAEIDDALEKLANRQSRESMRRLRQERSAEQPPSDPPSPPPGSEREKSELYLLAAARGLGRGRLA